MKLGNSIKQYYYSYKATYFYKLYNLNKNDVFFYYKLENCNNTSIMAEQHHNTAPNQFINFDQFVMQHNLSQGHSNNNSAPVVAPTLHRTYEHQNPPTITGSSRNLLEEIIRNSNLTPTANEFVPMQTYYAQPIPQPYQSNVGATNSIPLSQEVSQPTPQVDIELAQALNATNIGRQQGAIRKNNFGSNSGRPPDYYRRNNNNWNNDVRSGGGAGTRTEHKRNNGSGHMSGQYENRRHNGSGRLASQQNDHYTSNRNGYYNNRNNAEDMG